jgi:hypothetical protein
MRYVFGITAPVSASIGDREFAYSRLRGFL